MSLYQFRLTAAGRALEAASKGGAAVQLTHMVLGDGGGGPITFSEGMTALVREKARLPLLSIGPLEPNSPIWSAVANVPHDTGGFPLYEVGLVTASGVLYGVGNYTGTVKPLLEENAVENWDFEIIFVVSNEANVTLVVDPNLPYALKTWVSAGFRPASIVPGGNPGDVLVKKSTADGDFELKALTALLGQGAWKVKANATTVAGGDCFRPDNASAAAVYYLTETPGDGDTVRVRPGMTKYSVRKVTFQPGAKTIGGLTGPFDLTLDDYAYDFTWSAADNTWLVYRTAQLGRTA